MVLPCASPALRPRSCKPKGRPRGGNKDKHTTTSAFCFLCFVQIISLYRWPCPSQRESWGCALKTLQRPVTIWISSFYTCSQTTCITASQHHLLDTWVLWLHICPGLFVPSSLLSTEAFCIHVRSLPTQSRADAQLSSPTSSPLMSLSSMLLVKPSSEEALGKQKPMSELFCTDHQQL